MHFGMFSNNDRKGHSFNEYRKLIQNGDTLVKYSFSDSRAIERFFWLSSDCLQLFWGTHKGDARPLNVKLEEVVGIVFGPSTTTFSRLNGSILSWCCFSLIFVGRTLDLCTLSDTAHIWFLALQRQIGLADWDIVGYSEVIRRKVCMKICYKAASLKRSLGDHFRQSLEESHSLLSRRCSKPNNLVSMRTSLQNLKLDLANMRKLVQDFSRTFPMKDLHCKLMSGIQQFAKPVDSNQQLYLAEMERKRLHNELLDLKGNIRVFARVRGGTAIDATVVVSADQISVFNPNDARKRSFNLDYCFGPTANQTEVFTQVAPFIQSAMDGYNVCIFAYGATGGGKTYTMEGTLAAPGVNVQAIEKIFQKNKSLDISILQVYNEQVFDLLNGKTLLEIKLANTCFTLPHLVCKSVSSVQQAMNLISAASLLRATNKTNINEASSRSHCIVTLRLLGGGCLNLIDLAGSENVNKSGAKGSVLKEAQNINKSLSSLGDVIHQLLASKAALVSHIPYRNSKLTMILKDSLAGNSKTLMIVQVSPNQEDITETIGTLSFGTRVKTLELGKAALNKLPIQIRE